MDCEEKGCRDLLGWELCLCARLCSVQHGKHHCHGRTCYCTHNIAPIALHPVIALRTCIHPRPFSVYNTSESMNLVTLNSGWSLYKISHRLCQCQAKSDPGSEGLESTSDLQSFHDQVPPQHPCKVSRLVTVAVLNQAGCCMAA